MSVLSTESGKRDGEPINGLVASGPRSMHALDLEGSHSRFLAVDMQETETSMDRMVSLSQGQCHTQVAIFQRGRSDRGSIQSTDKVHTVLVTDPIGCIDSFLRHGQ